LLDYVEMMRRLSDAPNVSALEVAKTSLFRVPPITERILPFCTLLAAVSCYLARSRRLEDLVPRAAGLADVQFLAPASLPALGAATTATPRPGHWRPAEARVYAPGQPPRERDQYVLDTNLTPEQVRETFSTHETVPFWQLPYSIGMAERAGLTATGYRLQYQ